SGTVARPGEIVAADAVAIAIKPITHALSIADFPELPWTAWSRRTRPNPARAKVSAEMANSPRYVSISGSFSDGNMVHLTNSETTARTPTYVARRLSLSRSVVNSCGA